MLLRGIVRTAELVENPPGSDVIELVISAQGVGPNQPRRFVVPYALLVADESLDPDLIRGHAFQAEVEQPVAGGPWVAVALSANTQRVLREEE